MNAIYLREEKIIKRISTPKILNMSYVTIVGGSLKKRFSSHDLKAGERLLQGAKSKGFNALIKTSFKARFQRSLGRRLLNSTS